MSRKTLVAFDLDGTLVDSLPDLIATLDFVLAGEGLSPVGMAVGRSLVGAGARALIERGLALQAKDAAADKVRVDRLFRVFLDHYTAHIADHSRPFAGVRETLEDLMSRGHRLAVVTNKLEGLSRELLRQLDLDRYFDVVAGQDTYAWKKPDPRHLTLVMEAVGVSLPQTLYVGDSETDVKTARAAGVPIIGVTFGYSDVSMADLAPDHLIDDFADVAKITAAHFGY